MKNITLLRLYAIFLLISPIISMWLWYFLLIGLVILYAVIEKQESKYSAKTPMEEDIELIADLEVYRWSKDIADSFKNKP